jgi:acetoin utilization deacetylase AcuC-like enzyme
MIPVFYRPEQSSDAAESFSPSAGKPKLVIEDWLSHPEIAPYIQIDSFAPVSDALFLIAHDAKYVRGVFRGEIPNGFGNTSREIADSLRYTIGSLVAATERVLETTSRSGFRVAVSPTSGFHHAEYGCGNGFCTFNGLMIAAIKAHTLGLAERILILDMDQHYGNGTDDIIRKLAIDYVDHITAGKPYETASQALRCADLSANDGIRGKRYDLVLYQAGADIHVDDPLGGLLTTEQMVTRDELVFRGCATYGVPIVWNLAGGYQRDSDGGISRVLALHRNTMHQCISQATAIPSCGRSKASTRAN